MPRNAPARVVENVAGLVAICPLLVLSGHLRTWCQHTRRVVHFVHCAEGLQLAAHGLVDFASRVVIGRGDNRVFWARNLAPAMPRCVAAGPQFHLPCLAVGGFEYQRGFHSLLDAPQPRLPSGHHDNYNPVADGLRAAEYVHPIDFTPGLL